MSPAPADLLNSPPMRSTLHNSRNRGNLFGRRRCRERLNGGGELPPWSSPDHRVATADFQPLVFQDCAGSQLQRLGVINALFEVHADDTACGVQIAKEIGG